MKRILPILLFFVVTQSNAQFKKGDLILGGTASFNQMKAARDQSSTRSSGLLLDLSTGAFISDRSVIGVYGRLSNSRYTSNTGSSLSSSAKSDAYGAGIFYRHYAALARNLYIFGDLSAGFNTGKTSSESPGNNYLEREKYKGASLVFKPGLSYQVLKRIHLELALPGLISAEYSKTERLSANTNEADTKAFSVRSSLASENLLNSFAFGFRIFI